MAGMKLESKNLLERELPNIRKHVSELPEIARFRSPLVVYANLLWIRDKCDEISREIFRIENQEVLPIDDSASQIED